MRVAMIQMDMQLGKPEANFEKAEKLVRRHGTPVFFREKI